MAAPAKQGAGFSARVFVPALLVHAPALLGSLAGWLDVSTPQALSQATQRPSALLSAPGCIWQNSLLPLASSIALKLVVMIILFVGPPPVRP